jgi:aquaporin rerated protein, other eukaryote
MLVFTIVILAMEKHRATFVVLVGIGLALFIGELVAVYYTGGSLNPARSFGPAAVSHNFQSDHWIYWVGPLIGTILSVLAYWLFKALEHEIANPGQDGDFEHDPTQNPDHEIAQIVEERQAEVEEIKAIEEEGGFEALNDISAEGSALGSEGVISTAVEGVREGDEVRVQTGREGEPDLEAAWLATQGVDAAHLEKMLTNFPKLPGSPLLLGPVVLERARLGS